MMEWVAAALIFIAVLYKFPKFTISLIGLTVFVGICIVGYLTFNHYFVDLPAQQEREEAEKSVSVFATYNTNRCRKEFPIEITITNNSKWDIKKISFSVLLYEINYSQAKATNFYSNDRVIKAGASYNTCYRMDIPEKDIFYLNSNQYAYSFDISFKNIDFSLPDEKKPWHQNVEQISNRPITEEQYKALPSGAPFIAPDGSRRIKP